MRAIQFAHRLGKSAERKESLDDVVLEVAEAVAQHWLDMRLHYIACDGVSHWRVLVFGFCCGCAQPDLSARPDAGLELIDRQAGW